MHESLSLRMRPPYPVLPGFPLQAPSVLIFTHPEGVFFQPVSLQVVVGKLGIKGWFAFRISSASPGILTEGLAGYTIYFLQRFQCHFQRNQHIILKWRFLCEVPEVFCFPRSSERQFGNQISRDQWRIRLFYLDSQTLPTLSKR